MAGADTSLKPSIVFISGVSNEFGTERQKVAHLLDAHGADVRCQQSKYPTYLADGPSIRKSIEDADFIICLIGQEYGWPLSREDCPEEAPEGCSWTQWEYIYSRKVVDADKRKYIAIFYNEANAESPTGNAEALSQKKFREDVLLDQTNKFGGVFFYKITKENSLSTQIKAMLHDNKGPLYNLKYSYWLRVKDLYQAATRTEWKNSFPNEYTANTSEEIQTELMNGEFPPFIETQNFSILKPGDKTKQRSSLSPDAFLTGRTTEKKLRSRLNSTWNRLTKVSDDATIENRSSDRHQLQFALQQPLGSSVVLGTVPLPERIRLCLVCGSGAGKSTNMRWLEASLNGLQDTDAMSSPREQRLGLRLSALNLRNKDKEELIEALVDHVISKVRDPAIIEEPENHNETWHKNAIYVGLSKDLEGARVVILIDELDHIDIGQLPFLVDVQASEPIWGECPVVVAGRPHALLTWEDLPSDRGKKIAAFYWRFIEPEGFTSDESRIYLGLSNEIVRFDAVEEYLGELLNVPRILEYVRHLKDSELTKVRTTADIYASAIRHLVEKSLEAGGEARAFGPHWQENQAVATLSKAARDNLVEYVLVFLSALAFMSLCQIIDPRSANNPMDQPRNEDDDEIEHFEIRNRARNERAQHLRERIQSTRDIVLSAEDVDRDFRALSALSALIGNGLIEETNFSSSFDVVWANRTVPQFLAAYWLSAYADGHDAMVRLSSGAQLTPDSSEAFDTLRFRNYVYFPEADHFGKENALLVENPQYVMGAPAILRTDTTYELNVFLAEMPPDLIEPKSWVAAASAWYDPQLFSGEASPLRLWSSEMLFRSWLTMHACAHREVDDWWDAPYDQLSKHQPGRSRAAISPHFHSPRPRSSDRSDAATRTARLVLDRFFGDFQQILADKNRDNVSAVRELISEEQWVDVPQDLDFKMGAPGDRVQGCPTGKVEAYWHERLEKVQTRRVDSLTAAKDATLPEWFVGNVGDALRERDIEWLAGIFKSVAEDGAQRGLNMPDRKCTAYESALNKIHTRWHAHDETPAENPQKIEAFKMNRLPVLNHWYWLFSPGHKRATTRHLRSPNHMNGTDRAAGNELRGDNPVIYATWYDAWVFCQWAKWEDPSTHVRYGVRLPHEPEWEFAARWYADKAGTAKPSPQEWLWWWGDDFYSQPDAAKEELLSRPRAHADGRPGKTRAPGAPGVVPNGLGFHDILGNVWEWTANLYDLRKEEEIMNTEQFSTHYSRYAAKQRPPVCGQRTVRGGLWYYLNVLATCCNRFRLDANDRDFKVGFRVVRESMPPGNQDD